MTSARQKRLNWAPVIFVFIILSAYVYVYFVLLCIQKIFVQENEALLGASLLSNYVVLQILFLWCYVQGLRVKPGYAKETYQKIHPNNNIPESHSTGPNIESNTNESSATGPHNNDNAIEPQPQQIGPTTKRPNTSTQSLEMGQVLNADPSSVRSNTYTSYGFPSGEYCQICEFPKPYRAHHCSECERCVLKMDHHCPWLNNCIGNNNLKIYYLILIYGSLLSGLVSISLLVEGIIFIGRDKYDAAPYVFLVFSAIAFIFFFNLLCLFFYHTHLILRNKTTIENIQEGNASCYNRCLHRQSTKQLNYSLSDYDLGWYKNTKQVLGENPIFWVLPVYSENGYGLNFPTRSNPSPPKIGHHHHTDDHSQHGV